MWSGGVKWSESAYRRSADVNGNGLTCSYSDNNVDHYITYTY